MIRDGPKQFQVEPSVPHRVTYNIKQLSGPETLPQLSRCAESYLRFLVFVVLPGPPLIYYDGKQLDLFPGKLCIHHWVDAAVYQHLHNLERGAG